MISRLSFLILLFALSLAVVPVSADALECDGQVCLQPGMVCAGPEGSQYCQLPAAEPTGVSCGTKTCDGGEICCNAPQFPNAPFCSTQSTCTAIQNQATQPNTTPSPSTGDVTNNNNNSEGSNSGVALINPLKVDTVPEFLALILAAVVNLGTIILVLMLVYVGFLFVVAQGNEEKLQNAKSALLWTVVGGLVLLGAQAISLVIQATVGSLQ